MKIKPSTWDQMRDKKKKPIEDNPYFDELVGFTDKLDGGGTNLAEQIRKILKEDLKYWGVDGKKMGPKLDEDSKNENYMFFQNLKEIKENIESILSLDENEVDNTLSDGHGWALEHMATAKDDIEEVASFLKHRK